MGATPQRWAQAAWAAEPFGVVAGGDQERGGGVDTDPVELEQLRCGIGDELGEQRVEACLLLVEGDHAPTEHGEGGLRGVADRWRGRVPSTMVIVIPFSR
jgi:hypothetical protein